MSLDFELGTKEISVQFDLDKNPASATQWTAAHATSGVLNVSADGQNLFSFDWTWVELIEWLGQNWSELTHNLSDAETAFAVNIFENSTYKAFEEKVWEFKESHDLARAVQGALIPSVIVSRVDDTGMVSVKTIYGKTQTYNLPWSEVEDILRALGDCLAGVLRPLSDPRAVIALKEWDHNSAVV